LLCPASAACAPSQQWRLPASCSGGARGSGTCPLLFPDCTGPISFYRVEQLRVDAFLLTSNCSAALLVCSSVATLTAASKLDGAQFPGLPPGCWSMQCLMQDDGACQCIEQSSNGGQRGPWLSSWLGYRQKAAARVLPSLTPLHQGSWPSLAFGAREPEERAPVLRSPGGHPPQCGRPSKTATRLGSWRQEGQGCPELPAGPHALISACGADGAQDPARQCHPPTLPCGA
jgi:hypothetical protein